MSEEAGFLQAIREGRTDPTPRLVYADWLDDRSDPRGEYLRLQAQLAETTARLAELGAELDPSWVAEVRWPVGNDREIKLRSGRDIQLYRLDQARTYGSFPNAVPTREANERLIELAITSVQSASGGEPYLIHPEQRAIDWRRSKPSPSGTPARLPDIVCVGHFRLFQPVRDTTQDVSALTVIWFQDEYAFPIDPIVREQLLELDWERYAIDFDY